jgi:hypothetical protein
MLLCVEFSDYSFSTRAFQLWEDAQLENIRLRDDLTKVRDDLKTTQKKLDDAIAVIRFDLRRLETVTQIKHNKVQLNEANMTITNS